jgi:hypothetical protein
MAIGAAAPRASSRCPHLLQAAVSLCIDAPSEADSAGDNRCGTSDLRAVSGWHED